MKTTIYRLCACMLAVVSLLAASCTKNEEPPRHVGQQVPYTGGATHTLVQLLDSIPNSTIYTTAWKRAGISTLLDSMRAGNPQPYTVFAPSDSAFNAAGITLDIIKQMPVSQLDSLLLYLIIPGNYTSQSLAALPGNIEVWPPLTDAFLVRSWPKPSISDRFPYQYRLYLGWLGNTLQLNGQAASKAGVQSIAATDGALWPISTVVQKPVQDVYQLLSSDTSFSFYMAALRYSDQFYQQNKTNMQFQDTMMLQFTGNTYFTFLVPVNDAFRRAGFNSVSDITAYIDRSVAGMPLQANSTNMDSILNLHVVGAYFNGAQNAYLLGGLAPPGFINVFFVNDLLFNTAINNLIIHDNRYPLAPTLLPLHFQNNGGQVLVHRDDYPSGRAVHVLARHDIYTLNGVVHAVDNLLLPTP